MIFKFSAGNCQQTLSEVTIWLRYDKNREDNLTLKITFLVNISKYMSLCIIFMEGPY